MTIKYRIFVFVMGLLLCVHCESYSQEDIYSLKMALDTLEGNARVDKLIDISEYYNQNDAKKSIKYTQQAILEAKESGYREGVQKALHNLAKAHFYLFEYEKSLNFYREAIEYTDTSIDPLPLVKIYNNIGATYDLLDDSDNSILYYKKAIKILEGYENKEQIAATHINIALVFAEVNEIDSALKYLQESYSITLAPEFENNVLRPIIMVNMAELYIQSGDIGTAHELAQMALKQINNTTDSYTKSSVYMVLGRIYKSLGRYYESEKLLLKTIELAQSLSSPRREMEARRFLSDTYKEWGRDKIALAEFELYNSIKDSTLTAEKNRQILEIEAKYESEKQQKEIKLLKTETALTESNLIQSKLRNYFFGSVVVLTIIIFVFIYKAYRFKKRSNIELEKINNHLVFSKSKLLELNSMKDNLIRIIGHDLKGPLNSIMGFSELLSKRRFVDDSEKIKKFTHIILNTSLSINQLLDNILYWAKLQRGAYEIKKEKFNVKESIVQGVAPYQGIAESKNINVNLHIEDNVTAYGDKFTFSIIVGNLINNALKYSHNNSNVVVKVEDTIDVVNFSVSDSGVGIGEEDINYLFDDHVFNSTLGTKNEKGTGFGLKICKHFIDLNNGDISVESIVGEGTTFYCSFPKKTN